MSPYDANGVGQNLTFLRRLLEKFKIFSSFYYMSELRSREDLIKRIIENIDYSVDGHPRIVLSKALTSTYKVFVASL